MDRSEYHKEYRRKREALIHDKLDLLLNHFGLNNAGPEIENKPKVRPPQRAIQKAVPLTQEILADVSRAADSMKPICMTCGMPATHIYENRYFCETHHGRSATPI